ncbi:MAG: IgGFc-binding protein [Ignavibacteriales bacterium]|nr:IgGFc-binding protein [Ignavibacteriales bacterium]
MTNIQPYTSDAALALPVDTYNTEFIALTYHSTLVSSDRSMFAVTAAFNNTTVTITPSNSIVGGYSAGVPFDITLNKGEGFQARGLDWTHW